MILGRDNFPELRDAAAIALSLVVDEERLSDKQADWVWWQIAACAPPDSRPTPRRERPIISMPITAALTNAAMIHVAK